MSNRQSPQVRQTSSLVRTTYQDLHGPFIVMGRGAYGYVVMCAEEGGKEVVVKVDHKAKYIMVSVFVCMMYSSHHRG